MRKLFAAGLLTLALCSCSKEGATLFEGYYSYKLSGTVSFLATDSATTDSAGPDELTLEMSPESGQLNILIKDKASGTVVMTMNALGGGALSVSGKAEGSSLSFEDFTKYMEFEDSEATLISTTTSCRLTLSGSGEKLDDVLILSFTASGTMDYKERTYVVSGSEITCIARSNE